MKGIRLQMKFQYLGFSFQYLTYPTLNQPARKMQLLSDYCCLSPLHNSSNSKTRNPPKDLSLGCAAGNEGHPQRLQEVQVASRGDQVGQPVDQPLLLQHRGGGGSSSIQWGELSA